LIGGNRSLSSQKDRIEIINSFVQLCIEENQLNLALEAAKLGASQKSIDLLVESCISNKDKEDWETVALDVAELGASREKIDALVKTYIEEEKWLLAAHAAKLGASEETIDFLLETCAEKNWIFREDSMVGVMPIMIGGRKVTSEELENSRRTIKRFCLGRM
jgi:hypothetical protein